MFDALLAALERELQAALGTAVQGLVATARMRLEDAVAEVAKDKVKGLAEVAEERAKSLAEVDARREELGREVAAMHKHKEAQEGRVELNIGGYRFETSVQTLRRVPHTFFDAYFSGRYVQDVCGRQHLRGPGQRALRACAGVLARRSCVGGGGRRVSKCVVAAGTEA
jgi:hypothetical protein